MTWLWLLSEIRKRLVSETGDEGTMVKVELREQMPEGECLLQLISGNIVTHFTMEVTDWLNPIRACDEVVAHHLKIIAEMSEGL